MKKILFFLLLGGVGLCAFKPAPAPPVIPDYLSMKRADSLLRVLSIDLPSNTGLWYGVTDYLRSQHFILDYYKRSNATANQVGTFIDSLAMTDIGVASKGKILLGSKVTKVRLTPTSPVTIDNLAVSMYMETSDLSVYQTWLNDIAIFTRGRIKSQITPFDETWSIVDTDPRFLYYTITYKVLNNYVLNAGTVTSYKPLLYSVELRRFYKP